ncbi:putative salicylate hydroxylase [Colletotrichum karsti]|uniref:Salicylate hydroxylase n=1 Tax=Colletotrichum karsti TaxID=1095194 RepID=A0A9P6HVN0_9PEZI|nr:putative salicylate hydroxylase [Colletotrichum karsti]KAF9869696.1 putative salicylate hydroxylase [Colletotrichum karsti]
MPLKVVIIGSGIAGTASAAVLRRAADVSIIERGDASQVAGGQGIGLGPNVIKILDSLGWDSKRVQSVVCKGLRAYDAKTGDLVKTIPVDNPDRWGASWMVQLRADIRKELIRLATEEGPGNTPTIRYETKVTDVDTESGTVTLETGEQIASDVVVVAAGIHTELKAKVIGSGDFGVVATGQSIFRFLVSAENAMKAVGRLHEWWDPEAGGFLSIMRTDDGTNRALITYPCQNFKYVNFSCAFPNHYLKHGARESWFDTGDLSEVLEIFKDFPPLCKQFMQYAEEIRVWELRDHDPLPTYVRGRAVLVGDASHAMAPFQGQGAAQAIEDAEGLGLLLDPGVTRDDVPSILKQWDSARRPRASHVQLNTRLASRELNEVNAWKNMEFNWTYSGIRDEIKRGTVSNN